MAYQSTNPNDGKRLKSFEHLSTAQLDSALEAAAMDEKTTLGPLSTESALVQLLAQVEAAVKAGAKLLLGGKRIARPGWFMQPTILTDSAPRQPGRTRRVLRPGGVVLPRQERR